MPHFDLHRALTDFEAKTPGERTVVERFLDLHASTPRRLWRDQFPAHFTASAWLVSADGARALLMRHRKLDRWLQPGGHADGDADLPRVALREAEEETGLGDLVVDADIFDLDAHEIPARAVEPAHWHYDVRFVVRTTASEQFSANDESSAMAWRDVADIAADAGVDPSIRRMAGRWLERRLGAGSSQVISR
ncbi:MAG TPA: NUDIX hydrolase [Patescibacteria group bacterium]|nr:NUDIX hydrolase [Patescibacteria group bacterium]